jgi:hypothetical protein
MKGFETPTQEWEDIIKIGIYETTYTWNLIR